MKDLWNGVYRGQLDFSEANEDYEGTATDRENLGESLSRVVAWRSVAIPLATC